MKQLLLLIFTLLLPEIFAITCSPGSFKSEIEKLSVHIDFWAYVDDWFSIYSGNETHALQYIGRDSGSYWSTSVDLTTDDYFYVVAWSNLKVQQGFLSYLSQTISGMSNQIFTSGSSAWEVSATGRRNSAPADSSIQSFAELNTQIQLSNSGNTHSKGWISPDGKRLVNINVNGFRFNSKIVWYNSNGASDPTLGSYNHQEYLIFRISAGEGYNQICYDCKYGKYCLGGTFKSQYCPIYQTTGKYGAFSTSECKSFPKAIYQNLNKVTTQDLYEVSFTLLSVPGYVYYQVKCDENLSTQLDCKLTNLLVELTFSDCSSKYSTSETSLITSSIAPQTLYVSNEDCTVAQFKSSHKILNIYYEYQDTTLSQSYVQASKHSEQHKRFFLYDNYNVANNILKFDSSLNEPVSVNYAPGKYSSNGLADNDYFNFSDPYRFTVIYLTNQNDTLIVDDTFNKNNKTSEIPTFYLLDGDDYAKCSTHCNIYGGEGSNTYSLSGDTNMAIYGFNAKDIINLNGTHPKIHRLSDITSSKPNSTTVKITFSSTQSLTLYNVTEDIDSINIMFGISCYSYCYECTVEDQCDVCSGCGYCNSTQCLWCNSTSFLQEGKCVAQCDEEEGYLINPSNTTLCTYCNTSNCQGCSDISYCMVCNDNYIPVKGVCEKCNVTYYSTAGDRKCTKCGTGCDYCNKTHCIDCSPGYLYAPQLSIKMCYPDQSGSVGNSSNTKSITANLVQKQLISYGQMIAADGSTIEIDYSSDEVSLQKILDPIQESKYASSDDLSIFYNLDGTQSKRMLASSNTNTIQVRKYDYLSQITEPWGSKKYANSETLISKKGCLITCHAIFLIALDHKINGKKSEPHVINDWLNKNGGYSGLDVYHSVLDNITPYKIVTINQNPSRPYALYGVENIFKYYRQGYFVIANIIRPKSSMHWVVMNGISDSEEEIYVLDVGDRKNKVVKTSLIRYAYVYKMKTDTSTPPIPTNQVNKEVYIDPFDKSDLSYVSCYKYSKDFTNSIHYKDAKSIMESDSIDLKKFSKVAGYTSIVQPTKIKLPQKTQICNQKNPIWSLFKSTFGITDGYIGQSFIEAGSQMCSFAMVLETLGQKDNDNRYYQIDSIDDILYDNSAYKEKQSLLNKVLTKNHINFDVVKSKKLFGLTSDIVEVSNSNLESLSSTVQAEIKNEFIKSQCLYIFEVLKENGKETYYVFSLNKMKDGSKVEVYDPVDAVQKAIEFSQITGYTKFQAKQSYYSDKLQKIHKEISGIPHQHIVLTYKQATLTTKKLAERKFYLTKWEWTNKDYFNEQTFTVIDPTTNQELQIKPWALLDGNEFILKNLDVYINKAYLLDTPKLVEGQECSKKEIMAFVRMNQHQYTTSQGKSFFCFDNSISSSQCPSINNEPTCKVSKCQDFFKTQLTSVESALSKQSKFPTKNSRYCALAKFAYLSGATEITNDATLVKDIQDEKFYRVAYTIYAKKSTCLMKPRQAKELYEGLYYNKAPKISNSAQTVDKELVLSMLIELIGSSTQSKEKEQEYVFKAIQNVYDFSDEKFTTRENAEDFGIRIESYGYLRSDLTLDQAIPGDIVIFSGNKDYPFGHVAVKSWTSGVWYSDHYQTKECPYEYSSYIVYN